MLPECHTDLRMGKRLRIAEFRTEKDLHCPNCGHRVMGVENDTRIGTNPTARDKDNDAKSVTDSFLAI